MFTLVNETMYAEVTHELFDDKQFVWSHIVVQK